MLQRAGGNFPLLADVNFGASFGLVSLYYKSRSSNVASAGTVRLASADPGIAFRNNANSGNLAITTDSSDNLLYNGHIIAPSGSGIVTSITGTANEIIASSATGAITLSTPQAIASTSSPTFAALTLTAPLTVANGGSGATSHTAYAVLTGGTTSTGAVQSVASVGTAGQVLTSNGAGALPTFTNATGTGTVNSGTQYQLGYYATSSSIISGDSSITTNSANQLLVPVGSASVPSYSFTGHTNTGMWELSDTLLFSAAGVQTFQVASTELDASVPLNMNSHKITSLTNGTAAQDAAAFGQIPVVGASITKLTYYLNTSTGTLSTTQILKFDTQVFDTLSEYSTGTGLFTPTATGYYYISCNIDFQAANATGEWLIEIYNNTGSVVLLGNVAVAITSGDYQGNVSGLVSLTAATAYGIRLHNTGSNSVVRGNGGTAVNATNLSIFRVL